jgi:hypothetical protein
LIYWILIIQLDQTYILLYSEGSEFPIFGTGTTGLETPEGIYCLDTHDQMKKHFKKYVETIGFKDVERYSVLLDKYKCKDHAIWNKYKDQIYVQYFGISLADFI